MHFHYVSLLAHQMNDNLPGIKKIVIYIPRPVESAIETVVDFSFLKCTGEAKFSYEKVSLAHCENFMNNCYNSQRSGQLKLSTFFNVIFYRNRKRK